MAPRKTKADAAPEPAAKRQHTTESPCVSAVVGQGDEEWSPKRQPMIKCGGCFVQGWGGIDIYEPSGDEEKLRKDVDDSLGETCKFLKLTESDIACDSVYM